MSKSIILLISLFVSLSLLSANAERLYKWVDDSGRVSYHDRPPPEGSGYRVERKVFKTRVVGEETSNAMRRAARKFPVTLYSVPVCSSCDQARSYLQSKKIPFTEKDVQSDVESKQELADLTGRVAVPIVMVGEKIVRGYVKEWLEGELMDAGYLEDSEARSSR